MVSRSDEAAHAPIVSAWSQHDPLFQRAHTPCPRRGSQISSASPLVDVRITVVEGAEGPQPGWYDHPQLSGKLCWWDGTRWTEHTQEKPSAAPPTENMGTGAQVAPARLGTSSVLPWVAGAIGLVAIVALIIVLATGDGSREASETEKLAADAEAKAEVRTAQTAIETYATDTGGSYEGATSSTLTQIEPSIDDASLAVESTVDSYTLTVSSETTGNEFTVARTGLTGTTTLTCTEAGEAGCPADGDWAS